MLLCVFMCSMVLCVLVSEVGGLGLIMMIQLVSGLGVCEWVRCRIWVKFWVVISPMWVFLDFSIVLVVIVVLCMMLLRSAGEMLVCL